MRAESAGLEPGTLNPYAVRVMAEAGIDISQAETKSVFDMYKARQTVPLRGDRVRHRGGRALPIFPGVAQRLHWSFPDPSQAKGSDEEKMAQVRAVRDEIRTKIKEWADSM